VGEDPALANRAQASTTSILIIYHAGKQSTS